MKDSLKILGLILLFCTTAHQSSFGQSDKEKAQEKAQNAIQLMNSGNILQSISILEEAIKLDPENFKYPYQLAVAQYLQLDFRKAIETLEAAQNHKDVTDLLYQLLGNCYDNLGQTQKAAAIYKKGLKKFPRSGRLYHEAGVVEINKKDISKALKYFEKGIEAAPDFASNYYWASKIFCSTSEEVWGMIYGEIFMNLERNSQRTEEVGNMLYQTYKSEIKITDANTRSVSFSQSAKLPSKKKGNPKQATLPFGTGIYEPTLVLSLLTANEINSYSLDTIRSRFIDLYFANGYDKSYSNVLFAYQKQIKDAGHMEAYNHWLLMKGDEAAFEKWQAANKEKWDNFKKWFEENPFKLDESNKFARSQYR